jgi:intraflagellar transport protein 46
MDLDSKLRPFIPEYIPTVGEVDAFIKMDRPDEKSETLGLTEMVTLEKIFFEIYRFLF